MNKYDFSKDIIDNLIQNIKYNDLDNSEHESHNKSEKNKNILVIITDNNNLNNILMKLLKLKNEGFEFHLILSNKAKELVDIEMIRLRLRPRNIYMTLEDLSNKDISKEIDIALVPTMTQNDIVKLALGIQDDISSSIMWKILWENKSLFIDISNTITYVESGKNEYLKSMINDYIIKLENMGVKKINSCNYANELTKISYIEHENVISENSIIDDTSKKVITEKDILKMKGDCTKIILSKNTIITPLACDTARNKGIEIIKK